MWNTNTPSVKKEGKEKDLKKQYFFHRKSAWIIKKERKRHSFFYDKGRDLTGKTIESRERKHNTEQEEPERKRGFAGDKERWRPVDPQGGYQHGRKERITREEKEGEEL